MGTAGSEGPETIKPDTIKPDTIKPDTIKPDTIKPDTIKPDTEDACAAGADSGTGAAAVPATDTPEEGPDA